VSFALLILDASLDVEFAELVVVVVRVVFIEGLGADASPLPTDRLCRRGVAELGSCFPSSSPSLGPRRPGGGDTLSLISIVGSILPYTAEGEIST
jgi:hypothetical protein